SPPPHTYPPSLHDALPISAVLLFVPLEQREIGHPEEPPGVAVDQVELAAEVQTESSEHPRDHRRLVGGEQHRRRRLRAERVQLEIGRAHVLTPVTSLSRMP